MTSTHEGQQSPRNWFVWSSEVVCRKKKWAELDWDYTKSAPALKGKNSWCLALLEKFLGLAVLTYHCITHREALWKLIKSETCYGSCSKMCEQNLNQSTEQVHVQTLLTLNAFKV